MQLPPLVPVSSFSQHHTSTAGLKVKEKRKNTLAMLFGKGKCAKGLWQVRFQDDWLSVSRDSRFWDMEMFCIFSIRCCSAIFVR